jgi:hypothetical protein
VGLPLDFCQLRRINQSKSANLYIALTTMPTIRPKVAPIAIDGTKIPQGTRHPYEIMTKPTLNTVARNRAFAILHCAHDLFVWLLLFYVAQKNKDSLAKVMVVPTILTFSEKYRHAFGHVYSQELVEVTEHSCKHGEDHDFRFRGIGEILSAESHYLEVEFNNESAVESSKYPKDDEENDFEEVPVSIVRDLENDEFSGSKWIHCLKSGQLDKYILLLDISTWSVTVATRAQKKLLHIVLMLKEWLIS